MFLLRHTDFARFYSKFSEHALAERMARRLDFLRQGI